MEFGTPLNFYEPAPRYRHAAVALDAKIYMWGGVDNTKSFSASVVEVFDAHSGLWTRTLAHGSPPPGVIRAAYTTLGGKIFQFGGEDNTAEYNTLHQLDPSTMMWTELESKNPSDGPVKKVASGMVSHGNNELVIFAGFQHSKRRFTNKLHQYKINEGKLLENLKTTMHIIVLCYISSGRWSSPQVTGQLPQPCGWFSWIKVEHQAFLFGGVHEFHRSNDLYILDMQKWVCIASYSTIPSIQFPVPRFMILA